MVLSLNSTLKILYVINKNSRVEESYHMEKVMNNNNGFRLVTKNVIVVIVSLYSVVALTNTK